jgi:hypothetical protein
LPGNSDAKSAFPVPEFRNAGMRGSIGPSSTWMIHGVQARHELKLDCGRLGRGPMHVWIDGAIASAFKKPGKAAPSIQSPAIEVDGRQIVVYAESRDFGDSIECDLFVDGLSATSGKPLSSSLPDRVETVTIASSGYMSPFDSVSLAQRGIKFSAWYVPAIGLALAARRVEGPSIGAVALVGFFCLGVWGIVLVLQRRLRALPRSGGHRRLVSTATFVASLMLEVTLLAVLLGLTDALGL